MCKKRSGFILIVLALVLFSGLFVSALSLSDCLSGKLSIVNNTIKNGTQYASYNASLRDNNISVLSCNSSETAIVIGSRVITCPSGSSNSFCVGSNTSSSSQVCTSYGWLGNCKSYATQYSYKMSIYGVNVSSVTSSGSSFVSCAQKCAINRTTMIGVADITSAPDRCYFGEVCDANVTIARGQNSEGYDLVWIYRYNDGTNSSFCACNGTETVNSKVVRISSIANIYNLPIVVNDSAGKKIDSVQLFVYSFNRTNRSAINSGVANVNVNYRCVGECDTLGRKIPYRSYTGQTNQYLTCVVVPGSACFNWSDTPSTCDSGFIFNISSQNCERVQGLTVNCTGVDKVCVNVFQDDENNVAYEDDNEISLGHASEQTNLRCALSSERCFKCDVGHIWNSGKGKCVRSGCVDNCTSSGGVCSSTEVDNSHNNASLECCDYSICRLCDSGYHLFNGTCVSNNCSGVKPSGVGVFLGANTTSAGVVNWTYSPAIASLGACQWKCNESGYRLNISDNVSCVEGVASCSEFGGICSSTALAGGVLSIGNCSTGSCYVCNQNTNYFSNGTACVYQACPSGKIFNGIGCVDPKPGCNGCVLNNKCVGNDTARVVRINSGSSRYYCNSSSNQFVQLAGNNQSCQFGAQCSSNLCGANGKCLDVVEEVGKSSSMITTIYCWIVNLGFGSGYNQCLLDNNVAANGS